MTSETMDQAVRRAVSVGVGAAEAFRIFTADFDSWWPRSHHIGKSPMRRAVIECRAGGRCYSEQDDGTECDWGSILVWEPPHRFVFSWQITATWQFEPDLAKASEVEVRFIPESDAVTRVELEHRHFERMGPGGETMRRGVESPDGWGGVLRLFAGRVARGEGTGR
jgi:uncharacterized protein YndB with AHSA1/START domain